MKIVFLTGDMRVKHFHMASALRQIEGIELHLLHMWAAKWRYFGGPVSHFVKDAAESGVFDSVQFYSFKRFAKIKPDLVYVNDIEGIERANQALWPLKLVCDVEDCALLDRDIPTADSLLAKEQRIFGNIAVDLFLFGSIAEMLEARITYPILSVCESRVQYPFVAKSTLPKNKMPKTEEFSVVYAGSVWGGGGYRDLFRLFERFGKWEVNLDIYMLNDWSSHNWKRLEEIADKYRTIRLFKRRMLFEIKESIQKYYAGLILGGDFMKVKATFGMKALEYAYAGVVPVRIPEAGGLGPVCNLSDGLPFGYMSTPEHIARDFDNYLRNFDWDFHLMDNHLRDFTELMLDV